MSAGDSLRDEDGFTEGMEEVDKRGLDLEDRVAAMNEGFECSEEENEDKRPEFRVVYIPNLNWRMRKIPAIYRHKYINPLFGTTADYHIRVRRDLASL